MIVTLMKDKFVNEYGWITEKERPNFVAIAVNGAIVVDFKLAGIPGLITSVLGTVIPSLHQLSLFLMSSFDQIFGLA